MLPSLKGNFIHLWINDEDWGPYVNMHQLNGDFIEEWFPEKDGIRLLAIPETVDVSGFARGQ